MPIPIECIVCGKIVLKPPSEHNRKYCSSKCYGLAQRIISRPKCSITDCNRKSYKMGFCNRHYLMAKRHGNPLHKPYSVINQPIRKPFVIHKGYMAIRFPQHHRADPGGYVKKHILIAEQILGRPLKKDEVCHHIDGNKLNNSPENIVVCKNNIEHIRLYHSPRSK